MKKLILMLGVLLCNVAYAEHTVYVNMETTIINKKGEKNITTFVDSFSTPHRPSTDLLDEMVEDIVTTINQETQKEDCSAYGSIEVTAKSENKVQRKLNYTFKDNIIRYW